MASAALPCIFPAVKIGNSYYGDGALRSHEPFAPAIRLGANRILVISTRDAAIKREDSEPQTYPSATDMIGHAFDILFNDSLDSDIERLLRINRLIAHIARKKRGALDLKPIDLLVLQPSKDLRDLARKYEEGIPKTLKFILKKAGDGRLSSYLLFEPEFIQALIDLGYRDTIEKRAELHRFLHPKKET